MFKIMFEIVRGSLINVQEWSKVFNDTVNKCLGKFEIVQ